MYDGNPRPSLNIEVDSLSEIRGIPLPPPKEQAAIVRYLDDADQQIQAYIAAKQRLITLLEEERQAITHQAVTRGLNPNVKLKPSGVEWLGDIPEHWEVRYLRTTRSSYQVMEAAITPRGKRSIYQESGITITSKPECSLPRPQARRSSQNITFDARTIGKLPRKTRTRRKPVTKYNRSINRKSMHGTAITTRSKRQPACLHHPKQKRHDTRMSSLQHIFLPRWKATRNLPGLRQSGASARGLNAPSHRQMSFPVPLPPTEEQDSIANIYILQDQQLKLQVH